MRSRCFVSLLLVWLVVAMPFSYAQNVTGGLFLDVDVPHYLLSSVVDIVGESVPGANVELLINNVSIRSVVVSPDGSFAFLQVSVPVARATITIVASLAGNSLSRSFDVVVDTQPPILAVVLPDITSGSSVSALVTVNEEVDLFVDRALDDAFEPVVEQHLLSGSYNISVGLVEGVNNLSFRAVDLANRSSVVLKSVVSDTVSPSFISTNLADMATSIKDNVAVRGKLSEQCAVTLFLNGRPKQTIMTEPDGTFRIPFQLERAISANASGGQIGLETGMGWDNRVRLVAVDEAGREASVEGNIRLTICGEGTWFEVVKTDPIPNVITPRLMLEGLQQVGVGFTYKYRGAADSRITVNPNEIRAIPLQFSPAFAPEWDNGRISGAIALAPRLRVAEGLIEGEGYVQLNLAPFDPLNDPGATLREREKAISDHRRNDVYPGFGAMKFYLVLEIPFTETRVETFYDQNLGETVSREVSERFVQKDCFKFSIMIDERIPDFLPDSFLRSTSEFLGRTIDIVDDVLDPIRTVGEYLFYGCFAGTFLMYFPIVSEKLSCEFSAYAGLLGGQGFSVDVASIGACEEVYAGDLTKVDRCQSCTDAKESRRSMEWHYRQLCDRTMCVSPPTLQSYVKDKSNDRMSAIDVPSEVMGQFPDAYVEDGKLFAGSDCSAYAKKPYFGTAATSVQNIRKVYEDYLKHKSDDGSKVTDCSGLHPATAECCGYEYMAEWSSACGTSAFGDEVDTFDEIKESACLAVEKAGSNAIILPGRAPIECNKVFNAMSGFCDPEGGEPIEPIRVKRFSDARIDEIGLREFAKEEFLYLFVIPPAEDAGVQQRPYDLALGYIVETLKFDRSEKTGVIAVSERHYFTADLEAVELPQYDVGQFFTEEHLSAYYDDPDALGNQYANFAKFLSDAAGTPVTAADARRIYDQVVKVVGEPDQQFIVRPDAGVVNAVRCLCFPTIVSYLSLIRSVLAVIKDCSDTILATGDGSPGLCQSMYDRYVCDIFFEAIACFAQKYNVGAVTVRASAADLGVGEEMPDIFGSLTSAGSELSRSVTGRYGKTSMYESVFMSEALVHSVCRFAFTGNWEFDFSAAYDAALEDIPVESVALIGDCSRRFLGPSLGAYRGFANWVYHFAVGVFPGSDLNLEVQLKCSAGYVCDEADGFVNGECDCNRAGAPRIVTIRPSEIPTALGKSSPALNTEVFYPVAGSASDGAVRYDTIILKYSWTDSTGNRQSDVSECGVRQLGSVPLYCSFNPFSSRFECSIGEKGTSIAFVGVDADGPHALPQKAYALDEPLNVTLVVQQEYPSPPDRVNDKHLVFEVVNQNGDVVVENKDNPYTLQTNGEYRKTLADIAPGIVVDESWFGFVGGARDYESRSWSSLASSVLRPGDDYIDGVQIMNNNALIADGRSFVLELSQEGSAKKYSLYAATPSTGISASGFNKGEALVEDVFLNAPRIYWAAIAESGEWKSGDTVIVDLKYIPVLNEGETVEIHVNYNRRVSSNPCQGELKTRPQPFRIRFTAYDSNDYGQPTDIIAVDYNGRPARIEQPFYVACAPASELLPVEEEAEAEEQEAEEPEEPSASVDSPAVAFTQHQRAVLGTGVRDILDFVADVQINLENYTVRADAREILHELVSDSNTRQAFENFLNESFSDSAGLVSGYSSWLDSFSRQDRMTLLDYGVESVLFNLQDLRLRLENMKNGFSLLVAAHSPVSPYFNSSIFDPILDPIPFYLDLKLANSRARNAEFASFILDHGVLRTEYPAFGLVNLDVFDAFYSDIFDGILPIPSIADDTFLDLVEQHSTESDANKLLEESFIDDLREAKVEYVSTLNYLYDIYFHLLPENQRRANYDFMVEFAKLAYRLEYAFELGNKLRGKLPSSAELEEFRQVLAGVAAQIRVVRAQLGSF